MRLTRNERNAVREYVRGLAETLPTKLERVILFGSKARARGSSRPASDTDLAVVVRGTRTPRLRTAVIEPSFDPIAHWGVDISPLLIPARSFRKGSPLIQRIKKEGVELWSRRRNSLSSV